MGKWRRRLRAAIGIGLTWGAAWLGAGLALLAIVGPDAADVPFPLFFGLLGFIAGALFSGVLGTLASRARMRQLSFWRFAGVGAVGGLLLAAIMMPIAGPGVGLLVLGPVFAGASALCAAGTLALAKRADALPRVGSSSSAEVAHTGRDLPPPPRRND